MKGQLDLGPSFTQRANQISKRASKQRRSARLRVLQPALSLPDDTFRNQATAGVPATRADCPTGYCPHVRCRWHLALETAEHRAGRPGLSSVPRDSSGLTLSTPGHAGDARPGSTLRPSWLTERGLHLEREVVVYVTEEYELLELKVGALSHWLSRMHEGEAIEAYDTETLGLGDEPLLVARAHLRGGRIAFDRELPEYVIRGWQGLRLVRVRETPSCALDEVERLGKMTNEEVGDALGRHRTLIAKETKSALRKAIEEGKRRGIQPGDLMRTLVEIGADRRR